MEIKVSGNNKIVLVGKKESVVINPEAVDLKKVAARLCLFTKPTEITAVEARVVVAGPGEYEVGGIEVLGVADGAGNTVYSVVIDGVGLVVLGNSQTELNDKKIEKLSGADVLVAEVEGNDNGANKNLLKIAKAIGVNYLIPAGGDETALKDLMNVTDNEGKEAVKSLKVDKDNLPEGMELVILKES